MLGRRGPSLVRAAATTAVVAGTAGAVSHHQQEKYAAQDQAPGRAGSRRRPRQHRPLPPQPEQPAYMAELEQLNELKTQGIITEEEFEAKKAQILGV